MDKFRLFFERWKWYFVNAFILVLLLGLIFGISLLSRVNDQSEPTAAENAPLVTQEISVPEFSFIDAKLDASIKQIWSNENAGTVFTEEAFAGFKLPELDLSNQRIASLEGIQSNQSITQLDLSGNALVSISPLLSMASLSQVDLRDGSIDPQDPLIMADVQLLQSRGVEVLYDQTETTEIATEQVTPDYDWLNSADTQESAVAYSQEAFDAADSCVLVSEGALPDFASSALLAAKLSAPVFPISDGSNQSIFDEINRLGQDDDFTVYIIGGDYVIPDSLILEQSFNANITIQRIYGAHMDGTAVAVLSALSEITSVSTAYVVNGAVKSSCVTAANLSAQNGYPVLLVDYSGVSDATLAAVSEYGITDIIVLGEGVTQKVISAMERTVGSEHVTKQGEE